MIRASVGVSLWKHLLVTTNDNTTKDILHNGSVSCAYFVSCILKIYNLTGATFANVMSLKKHCIEYGWKEIPLSTHYNSIPPGSLIVRDHLVGSQKVDIYDSIKSIHYHIGFYMGDQQAISNMSDQFNQEDSMSNTPALHHRTFHDTRKIQSILTFSFNSSVGDYMRTIYPAGLINHQLEIPFIGMTKTHLEQYGISGEELLWALGTDNKDNILNHGRMCGPACIVSAYQYITGKNDKTLQDTLLFKDKKHTQGGGGFYFVEKPGRYHDGLIAIAKGRGLDGYRGEIDHNDRDGLKQLIAQCIEDHNVLICSVSPGFDPVANGGYLGGHLVIIRGYNRNGYQEELIINDSLNENNLPTPITLSSFINSWSGRYIVIKK